MDDTTGQTVEYWKEKIAGLRQRENLTHWELARLLNVPVYFTEILENGVLICTGDEQYARLEDMPFAPAEMEGVRRALSKGFEGRGGLKTRTNKTDDEMVFFLPMTVNRHSIAHEMDFICSRDGDDLSLGNALVMKYRLYCRQMCLRGKRETALAAKRFVVESLVHRALRLKTERIP